MMDLILYIGPVALIVLLVFVFMGEDRQSKLQKRVLKLKERKVSAPQTAQDALKLRRQAADATPPFIEMLLKPLPNFTKLNNLLERAGVELGAQRFTLRCLLGVVIMAFIAKMLGKPLLLGGCIGIILCCWLPLKVLQFRVAKQQKKFLQLFPDAIDLIVRGLRSGLPVSESIKLVSEEVPAPVSSVFEHVTNTMKLGVSLEKALQEIAKKLDYTEFNFFVTSIVLQRETGGNLSEILNNLGDVLRKRFMMKMKIKAMTSEARASAIIIGCLPFLVSAAVSVLSPGYMAPLFTDARGNIALLIAAGMLFSGVWIMQRMAKFDI